MSASPDSALPADGRSDPPSSAAPGPAAARGGPPAGASGGPRAALPPLSGGQLVVGTIALSLATFMNVLDTSIANVSIPAIAGDMGVSPDQGTWVITSFAVANAISVPLTGWLTRRLGQVKLFIGSVLLFVISSWLCGLAPSMGLLIMFRVIQGLVAGPMIPLSQTLLLSSYPPEKAGTAMAMWAMTVLVAPVAGPLLGGWITDNVSWPWIFYINIPVGLISAGLTWSIYAKRDPGASKAPLDYIGLALMIGFVATLQIMIDKGKDLDWFGSPLIVLLAVISGICLSLFLAWELTERNPIVDLRLFGQRNFLMGTASLSVAYGLFFGNVVLLPLWLQQYMGYTATWAGLATAPVGILAIILSPWVGKNVSKIDPRKLVTVSFLGFALVLWMRSRFNTQADFGTMLIPTLLQGIAMAFFFVPLQTIIFSGLTPDRIPAASGLSNFARITAGAIGTSLFTTVWDNRAELHHSQLVERITGDSAVVDQTIQQMMAGGLSHEQALGAINQMVNQQAYTLAVDDVFYLSSSLFIVLLALVWLTKPKKGAGAGAGGGAH